MYAFGLKFVKRLRVRERRTAVFQRAASAEKRRSQSKWPPGSVLRPGATSLCAAISRSGSAPRSSRTRRASGSYCVSAKACSGVPSSSTPTEKSLQRSRARQREAPACQARSATGTNWISSPSRRMRKWDETRSPASSANEASAEVSSRLVNKRSIASPPYLPRGRLIECRSRSETSVPGGRLSRFGDSTRRAPTTQPSATIRLKRPASQAVLLRRFMDSEPLHAVAQGAEGHAEQFRGRGAVEAGLRERFQDRFAFDAVEIFGQRRIERAAARAGRRLL